MICRPASWLRVGDVVRDGSRNCTVTNMVRDDSTIRLAFAERDDFSVATAHPMWFVPNVEVRREECLAAHAVGGWNAFCGEAPRLAEALHASRRSSST